ncbi:MAG: PhnD/SsuA/transferrin family substrate-binding protein [Anaerolineales bacterium]|jgi:phosphonate transport system substrate-binding protein
MDKVYFTPLQAPNQEHIFLDVANYIADRLDISIEVVLDLPWVEREKLLDSGEIDIGWICGYPYITKVDRYHLPIELLVAPVMQHPRYQDQPIYFSDVVVHAESPFQTFADLRGASWAYNEPGSHSGYILTRYHLATLGEISGYFGDVVEAGSHQNSLALILNRQVDASAIDSTVLELEMFRKLDLAKQIRIIETFGPSPIPPWVISKGLPSELKKRILKVLQDMHLDPLGGKILATGNLARFTKVSDPDYDTIREMAQLAEGIDI